MFASICKYGSCDRDQVYMMYQNSFSILYFFCLCSTLEKKGLKDMKRRTIMEMYMVWKDKGYFVQNFGHEYMFMFSI